jgi:predicted AAA+ superfamily ATPase
MSEPMDSLYPRFVLSVVATAPKDTPVVIIIGSRQCGKTTLVRDLVPGKREFLIPTTIQFWHQREAIQQD